MTYLYWLAGLGIFVSLSALRFNYKCARVSERVLHMLERRPMTGSEIFVILNMNGRRCSRTTMYAVLATLEDFEQIHKMGDHYWLK